jgi:hypothetical protein
LFQRRGERADGEDDGSNERGGGNPARHFANSVEELFDYSLRDLDPSDMVGISIHNADIQQDKPIGFSFRSSDQISNDVLWSVFEVAQSNARYQALYNLTFRVDTDKMPVGFGKARVERKTHV